MKGCDISQFQGLVNFDQLKSASEFVIIRAGYSGGGMDTQLRRNQTEARRIAMPHGYYWFAYPDRQPNAAADADAFLATVGTLQPGEVLVLDFEVAAGGPAWCKTFLDHVYAKTGVRAYLYTNQSRTVTLDWTGVKNIYPLWLAIFDNNPTASVLTNGWIYYLKQYTADGRMPGISTAVDLDQFYGDKTKFLSYGYKGDTLVLEKQPPVFSAAYYLSKYPDVKSKYTLANAVNHWIDYGIKEGRMSAPNFHVKEYMANYSDLRTKFGATNYAAGVKHYFNSGINEGRSGVTVTPPAPAAPTKDSVIKYITDHLS